MCQALSVTADSSEITDRFGIEQVLSYRSNRQEINTHETVSIILEHKETRILDEYRWGLVPFWAKDSFRMDSAELLQKPIFERIIKKQRCVIPCSGFYVTRTEGKVTERMKVTMRTGTFGIAGLYDVFKSASGEEVRTCTLLMTPANLLIAPFESRMPAILEPEDIDAWLKPESKLPFELKAMLRPMDELRMVTVLLPSTKGDRVEFDMPRPEWI
ncbi:SOS response-associated peptidase [Paenibacillus solisilvae]|uniref:Abasic site processing protein n=1 Tax=Paenibacillus solisilvae TaxID=2486751 RepID=A0ABW0VYH2_9BACL